MLRELKVGDTLRQFLTDYPVVYTFTVLAILWENKEEIKIIAFCLSDPPGIFEDVIKRKFIENEYFKLNGTSVLRTEIL